MNAAELIKEWPCWRKANAETVFGSPAWRVLTEYNDGVAAVKRGSAFEALVALDVMMDDSPNRIVIGANESFRDLMRLKGRLDGLPAEVVIALVEKECGTLLQTIENVFERQLRIRGVAAADFDGLECFTLVQSDGETGFAVGVEPAMIQTFGALKNLDSGHEAIRSLTRETSAEYAEINLLESELGALAAGDRLLIPDDALKAWRTDSAADDLVHVRAAEPATLSFANFADDDLPEVPEAESVVLIRRGSVIAHGRFVTLGLARAVEIISV